MANYKRASSVIAKQAGDELVLLHSKSGDYYTLNPLGKKIWDFCSEPKTEEEIICFVSVEHNMAIETAKADVVSYLESLVTENLFEKLPPGK